MQRSGGGYKKRFTRKSPRQLLGDDSDINFLNVKVIKHFINERGKIVPRRVTGLNAKQQRLMTRAIKRARNLGLLPYTTVGLENPLGRLGMQQGERA